MFEINKKQLFAVALPLPVSEAAEKQVLLTAGICRESCYKMRVKFIAKYKCALQAALMQALNIK